MSTLSCFHSRGDYRGRSSQKTLSVSVTQPSESPFSFLVAHLLEDQKFLDYCCHCCFFMELRQKQNKTKINHPVVCKTRKHQLKTILCIIYYFMLGWNLGACANSLYKLRLAGSVLGKVCGSVFRRVGVTVRGHGGSRDAFVSASSCPLWEMKTKKQCRLVCVLQSFLVGVCDGAGGGMNP